MNVLRRIIVLVLLAGSFAGVLGVAVAQTSLNFDGRWSVFAGGGQRQSASFALQDALGQPAGAVSSSASTVLEGGFVVGQDVASGPVTTPVPTVPPGTTPVPTLPPGADNLIYLPLLGR